MKKHLIIILILLCCHFKSYSQSVCEYEWKSTSTYIQNNQLNTYNGYINPTYTQTPFEMATTTFNSEPKKVGKPGGGGTGVLDDPDPLQTPIGSIPFMVLGLFCLMYALYKNK